MVPEKPVSSPANQDLLHHAAQRATKLAEQLRQDVSQLESAGLRAAAAQVQQSATAARELARVLTGGREPEA